MRKVAIFRSELLPLSETFVYQQARALVGWQPILVGFRRVELNGLDISGIDIALLPQERSIILETLRFWLTVPIPSFVKTLQSIGVDLVHAHFGTDATDIWPSVRAAGLPMLVTLHGYDININKSWWESGKGGRRRRVYPQRLLQMARHPKVSFIAVSQAIKERAIEYGIPADKVTVAYIGVDNSRFQPGGLPIDQRKKQILFVGRMVPKKAPLLLIEAYAEVLKQVPDAKLVMIGDGPLREAAEFRAKQLRIAIDFLGALNPEGILAQLYEARVLCLPSIKIENGDAEGFGLVLLEAQSCGVPVVSSAMGGSEEGLVHAQTGFRYPESELFSLISFLSMLLLDNPLAARFSGAASKFVREKFNISVTTASLEVIYANIISRSRA